MEFTFDSRQNGCDVGLSGRLVFSDFPTFEDLSRRILSGTARECRVCLRRLEFIDSAGLGMLLVLRDELASLGRTLTLQAPSGQVHETLQITNLGSLLAIEAPGVNRPAGA